MAFIVVAKKNDLSEGAMRSVAAGGTDVLLVNTDGTVFAYEDACGHMGVPLSCGTLKNNVITCSAHHWSYNACTGRGVSPDTDYLKTYPVKVEGEDILVDFGNATTCESD